MKFAVMQPYLFPYLGYYQLVNSVDKFIFYDDVTFIKGGFINRNNILSNGRAQRFTLPVPGLSSNVLINQLSFDKNVKKALKTIEQNYRKAPYFQDVYPIIERVLNSEDRSVEQICAKSVIVVFEYLDISKSFCFSSRLEYNRELSAAEKLVSMARIFKSSNYINSIGGKALYNKDYFSSQDIKLQFIKTKDYKYYQKSDEFVPNLSMIDVLMYNSKSDVIKLLNKYELI
ncbi:hypothetical protein CWN94_21275 [Vibrio splendidus]|uniref:WbqC family protein n=1 Tax=Vibrio splendidus TaxID=29497 RepID=UPI000D33DC2F|nr:WbqC family protein [Vibrio splendidus]PTO51476.1 hypothetical protein CWN94_21275 [Vibrio splendidus]